MAFLYYPSDVTQDDRAKMEWVVRSPQGGVAKVTARHERGGAVAQEVALPPSH
jgi:hypothetical protein